MERKIIFITKSLCYHQVGIADKLYEYFGDSFAFIQMREPLDFRVRNNQEGFNRPYLFGYQKNEDSHNTCKRLIQNAEIIIWGEASLGVLKCAKKDAILLKYSERIFKKDFYKINLLHYAINCINLLRLKLFMHKRNGYLLSAGYYSSQDYNRFGLFKGKSIRWGYFPKFEKLNDASSKNERLQLVWASRLLKWKHPEYVILAAKTLNEIGVSYDINIAGDGDEKTGEMKKRLQSLISKNNLSDNVHMLGKIKPKEVLELYKKSDIALFTSGPAEGWGVGLNEAMNYGCVPLASDKMGSARYLIKDKVNGFLFRYGSKKSFSKSLQNIINNLNKMSDISNEASKTIQNSWNCDSASARLKEIIEELLESKTISSFPNDGPCSLIGK